MAAIRAHALAKTFEDGTVAVADASFEVEQGEALALLGPNGAGKTTTIHMLLGLLPPTSGDAEIAGVDVRRRPLDAYRRVGYLSENVLLYGNLSALSNLRFFGRISGRTVPESDCRALLQRVGLDDVRERPVRTFSKGMRQRLGLAVALVKDPQALVLDEPTTGLDPDGADALTLIVRELAREGRAVLMSTHDLDRVHEFADRVAVMGGHRVSAIAPVSEVRDVRAFYHEHSGGAR